MKCKYTHDICDAVLLLELWNIHAERIVEFDQSINNRTMLICMLYLTLYSNNK